MMEMGHEFLARLGKKRLRPGGKAATEWLSEHGNIDENTKILEVACNMGTTMIEVAKKYCCTVTGLDLDPNALAKAKENVNKNKLEDKITVVEGSAYKLPFPDNSFDVVINEAMLTMQKGDKKNVCLKEYKRVLKPGGVVLTQDVAFLVDEEKGKELRKELSRAIQADVEPLTIDNWVKIFESEGFAVEKSTGKMTLLNPAGMIQDEGVEGLTMIFMNAMKAENTDYFKKMFTFFHEHDDELNYIAICAKKE